MAPLPTLAPLHPKKRFTHLQPHHHHPRHCTLLLRCFSLFCRCPLHSRLSSNQRRSSRRFAGGFLWRGDGLRSHVRGRTTFSHHKLYQQEQGKLTERGEHQNFNGRNDGTKANGCSASREGGYQLLVSTPSLICWQPLTQS